MEINRVKWSGSSEKEQWETIHRDLTSILQNMSGTVERKLDKMGDVIYSYGAELCGVMSNQHQREQEIDRLIRERRQLKKQWIKTSDIERESVTILQETTKRRSTTEKHFSPKRREET